MAVYRNRGILIGWRHGRGHLRNWWQGFDGRCLVAHAEHCVRVHREVDVGMPGQKLGRLGRNAGTGEVCYERLSQRMEIGVMAAIVDVGDACSFEILLDHL